MKHKYLQEKFDADDFLKTLSTSPDTLERARAGYQLLLDTERKRGLTPDELFIKRKLEKLINELDEKLNKE